MTPAKPLFVAALLAVSSVASAQQFGPRQVITTMADGARDVYAADLDGDGDMDVISASRHDDKIAWYENLGGGVFAPQRVISASANEARSVHATDLDGDGDADVLSACLGNSINFAWFENLGAGVFGPQRVIGVAPSGSTSVSIFAIDLDSDGDADVVTAWAYPFQGSGLAWYENLGGGVFGGPHVLVTSADSPAPVLAADLDGDGDADILFTSYSTILWFENQGGGVFGNEQVIISGGRGPVHVADMDSDGDVDVVANSNSGVAWFENLGGGAFGPSRPIAPGGAQSIHAADLDGDGDIDVAHGLTSWIGWSVNIGSGSFGAQHSIATSSAVATALFVADLDADGYLDVLSASESDDTIAWYRNLGPLDCNGNGVPDPQDLAAGTSPDCNGNGIPDECDLASGVADDCNANGILDSCDIAAGVSADCDTNLVPDECQIATDPTLDIDLDGILDACEAIGSRYCSPAVLNSTGEHGSLTVLGSSLLFLNDALLTARALPQGSFGFFITSQTQGYAFPINNSQGALCVLGHVGRYVGPGQIQHSGTSGSFALSIDLFAMPSPTGFVVVGPGETWFFQAWYRDANPNGTSNFTDAVSVTFQ